MMRMRRRIKAMEAPTATPATIAVLFFLVSKLEQPVPIPLIQPSNTNSPAPTDSPSWSWTVVSPISVRGKLSGSRIEFQLLITLFKSPSELIAISNTTWVWISHWIAAVGSVLGVALTIRLWTLTVGVGTERVLAISRAKMFWYDCAR